MRILHTSDWHLGRSLGEFRLLDDQAEFLDWLVAEVERQNVDLVAVAGDVFDRAVPPAEAVALFSDTVSKIRSAGAEIAMISGNHDSGERMAMFDGFTEASGVIVRGGFRRALDVTIREYSDGPLAIIALPFLDPALAPSTVRDLLGLERDQALNHDALLEAVLSEIWSQIPDGMRTLVLSHAFVRGGEPSGSERELAVGNAGYVSANRFDGFNYVALGHLHLPQMVDGRSNLRYCGSPLPYSFSERNDKLVIIVDMAPDGSTEVQSIPIPVGRGVHSLRGSFAELMDRSLVVGDPYVRVELTDVAPVLDAHRQLRSVFSRLVEIDRIGLAARSLPETRKASVVRKYSSAELANEFWTDVTGEPPSELEANLLIEVLDDGVSPGIRLAS